jgi:hypothetical protein
MVGSCCHRHLCIQGHDLTSPIGTHTDGCGGDIATRIHWHPKHLEATLITRAGTGDIHP